MKLLLSFIQAALFVAFTFGLQNISQGAITFNGTSHQMTLPSGTISNTTPKTFSMWIYPTSTPIAGTGFFYARRASSGGFAYYDIFGLEAGSTGKVTWTVRGNNGTIVQAISAGSLTNNAWNHIAGWSTSLSSHAVWLNGTKTTKGMTTPTMTGTLASIAIGSQNTGAYFAGNIAEVAAWNAALTDDEITALSKSFSPDQIRPQSLVVYLPLVRNVFEVKGTTVTNSAGAAADHPRVYQ
jgi:hypothetical protein